MPLHGLQKQQRAHPARVQEVLQFPMQAQYPLHTPTRHLSGTTSY